MIVFNKKYFPKSKFLLALSGGVDSISACHLLMKKNYKFHVVHVNHKFIKQDDVIADKVEEFCSDFRIPYTIIIAKERHERGSKEDFCRKIRYSSILNCATQKGYQYVCTAHHLDDCVESYFLNFLKGCPEYTPIQFQCVYPEATIFRPFLLNKKRAFTEYMMYYNLTKYVIEDEMNSDLTLKRNWTRQVILPEITKGYKGLHKVVFKKVKTHLDKTAL